MLNHDHPIALRPPVIVRASVLAALTLAACRIDDTNRVFERTATDGVGFAQDPERDPRYEDYDDGRYRDRRDARDTRRRSSGETTLPHVRLEGRLVVDAVVDEERPAPGLQGTADPIIPAGRLEIAFADDRKSGFGSVVDHVRTDNEIFASNNRLEWTEGFGYGFWVATAFDEILQLKTRGGIAIGAGESVPGMDPTTEFEWLYGGPRLEIQPEILILRGGDWHWSAYARGSAAGFVAGIEDNDDSDVTVGRLLLGEAGLRLRAGPTEFSCGYLWRDYEFEGTGDDFFGNDTPETRLDIEGIVVTASLRF